MRPPTPLAPLAEDPSQPISPIHRPGPQSVTYHIPTSAPRSSHPFKTTIHLPPHSKWSSGLHFHTQHTEYLRLVRGSISVQLGTERKLLSAAAGGEIDGDGTLIDRGLVVTVERKVRHNWGRADCFLRGSAVDDGAQSERPQDWDEHVVVEEWTDPSDLAKPLFFWNLNGVVTAPANSPATALQKAAKWALSGWWIPFQLFVIFLELDNWPVFWSLEGLGIGTGAEQRLESVVTFLVLFVGSAVARMVGVEAVTEDRTPKELWKAWRKGNDIPNKGD